MERRQNYGNRMWNIWGPLVMKFGISLLVYLAGTMLMTVVYITSEKLTSQELVTIVNDPQKYENMVYGITELLFNFGVPIEGIAALLTIPLFLFLMWRDRKKEKLKEVELIRSKAPLWKYPLVAVMGAALCLVLNNLILLADLSSYSESYEETMEFLYKPSFGLQILCIGILMPICEELTFRGLVYRRMRREMRFAGAALYSGLIFAITHGNLVQGFYAYAMAMMLCYVYDKYGSILAPILAHIAANMASLLGVQYHWFDWIFADVMRVGIVTACCACVASTVYVIMQRMESTFMEIPALTEGGENGGLQQ